MLVTHRLAEIQAAAKEQASFVKTKTESELSARILPLERLAGRWHTHGSSDEQDVKADAILLMSGYPTYQAIAAHSADITIVIPPRGGKRSGVCTSQASPSHASACTKWNPGSSCPFMIPCRAEAGKA